MKSLSFINKAIKISRSKLKNFLILGVFCLISIFSTSCDNENKIPAKVLNISDGDTLKIMFCKEIVREECMAYSDSEFERSSGKAGNLKLKSHSCKLRMLGIDTPEMKQQEWGKRAKAFLEDELKDDKYIFIETDIEIKDRYGRLLAYVYDSEGHNINERILKNGFAELLIIGANNKYATEFKAAEAYAREKELNIWSKEGGLEMSPYKFRKKSKKRR